MLDYPIVKYYKTFMQNKKNRKENMYLIIREIEYDTFENDYSVLGSADNMESANKLLDAHKLINKREDRTYSIIKYESPLLLTKEMEVA